MADDKPVTIRPSFLDGKSTVVPQSSVRVQAVSSSSTPNAASTTNSALT